jgi:flagellar biosynthetic protein FliQ
MTEADVLDIARDGIFVLLKVVTPILLVALGIGLFIGIFQALTQIQEMTLAFVPKILGVFMTLIILFPFMLMQMKTLSDGLFDRIVSGGGG